MLELIVPTARVRHKDQSGRAIGLIIQFKVSSPDISTYAESLRITEVNYHPIEASVVEQEKGWTALFLNTSKSKISVTRI